MPTLFGIIKTLIPIASKLITKTNGNIVKENLLKKKSEKKNSYTK